MLSEPLIVTSSLSNSGRVQIWWSNRNSDKPMRYFIQHDDFAVGTAVRESLPLKMVKHLADAAHTIEVTQYKSGRTSLNHINLGNQFLGMRIPHRRRVLENRANVCIVGLFFDLWMAFLQVATEKAESAVTLLANILNMRFPAKLRVNGDS